MKNVCRIFSVTIPYLLLCLLGCEDAPEDLFTRHFIIKKGEHYSTPRFAETLQTDRLVFKARFNESAIYEFADEALQSSKNKLFGFSDCNSLHHENSARFAWQWYNNRLEIYAYCYVDSKRVDKFIGTVNINDENTYEIQLTGESYIFLLNGENQTEIQRAKDLGNKGIYYLLYPYFGGTIPAPHNVIIDVTIRR